MDDYMVALITEDGKLNLLGYLFNYNYHAQCLIDYALDKYPQITGFKLVNYMEDPNAPIYYLSLLNNIVFTNISVDGEKRGILYLPKDINEEQLKTLYDLTHLILEFDVCLVYNMSRLDGTTMGKTFDFEKGMNIKEQLDDFVLKMKREIKDGKEDRRL